MFIFSVHEIVSSDNLKIESNELYSRDNAREHRTERYELVRDTGRVRISFQLIYPIKFMVNFKMIHRIRDQRYRCQCHTHTR